MAGDNSTDDLENTVVENPHSNDAATTSQDMRSSTTVNRLAVKVPPFWAERPEIWFAQIESQFCIAGITADKTKFHTVVASMESSVISQITDAVLNPPAVDMYGKLKLNIIERFCESEQKKIQKLLSDIDLGDRRPTQLLNELRGLAKDRINEDFLKSLWMQRLPPHARAILQASNDDLSGMAKLADKILEVEGLAHMNVASVAAPTGSTSLPAHSLHETVTRLDSLEKRIRSRSRSQSRSSANRDQNSSPAECLMRILGIKHLRTTAYHPESNGLVERWHRTLKAAIKCHMTNDWCDVLPLMLLGLRATWKEDLGASLAEMLFGSSLRVPGESVFPLATDRRLSSGGALWRIDAFAALLFIF
ncbi:hypothetical protein ACLKA6_009760 [Drosophila palustris]